MTCPEYDDREAANIITANRFTAVELNRIGRLEPEREAGDVLQHAKLYCLRRGDRAAARILALLQQNLSSSQQQIVEALWKERA